MNVSSTVVGTVCVSTLVKTVLFVISGVVTSVVEAVVLSSDRSVIVKTSAAVVVASVPRVVVSCVCEISVVDRVIASVSADVLTFDTVGEPLVLDTLVLSPTVTEISLHH